MIILATIFRLVMGSALAALEGRDPEIGAESIKKLMAAVDEYIPTPDRPKDQPFLMPIEDVFSNFWSWHGCHGSY